MPSTSHTLLQSLGLNLGVSIVGITVWLLCRVRKLGGKWSERLLGCSRATDVAGAHNYLLYLWVCGCMCLTLTVTKLVVLLAYGSGVYTALWSGENVVYTLIYSLHHDSGAISVWGIVCGMLDGCIALVFTLVIEVLARPRVLDLATREVTQRTLWLMHMPKRDRQTRYPFVLNDADILQVEQDLVKAINDRLDLPARTGLITFRHSLRRRWTNNVQVVQRQGESAIERCCVALDLDDLYKAKTKLDLTMSYITARKEALMEIEQQHSSSWCKRVYGGLRRAYLMWKLKRLGRAEEDLILKCQETRDEKRLSGSAFVTFKRKEDRDLMLGESAPCWRFRRYTYFSFGRPPFSSVTLTCRRAPAPDDIEWRNLPVGHLRRFLTFWIATFLLLCFMFLLVTPLTLVGFCATVLGGAKSAEAATERALQEMQFLPEHVRAAILRNMDSWSQGLRGAALDQMPTLVLLCINSLILPCVIEAIGTMQRSAQKSTFEVHQKRLNHIFLLLNMILFPFLGVSTLSAAAQQAPRGVQDLVGTLRARIAESSVGVFGLKYVLSAAFISSTIALTNVSQAIAAFVGRRCFAVTEQERQEISAPWPFAWGYWYAWTLSIFALTMLSSLLIPTMLPLATIFFFLRYFVDRYNLHHGVFALATDIEGSLVLTAVCDMKTTVGACWLVEGSALCGLAPLFSDDHTGLVVAGALQAAAGIAVIVWSLWSFQQQQHNLILHGEQQETPRLSALRAMAAPFEMSWRSASLPPAEKQGLLGGEQQSEAALSASLRSSDSQAADEVHWDGMRLLRLAVQ